MGKKKKNRVERIQNAFTVPFETADKMHHSDSVTQSHPHYACLKRQSDTSDEICSLTLEKLCSSRFIFCSCAHRQTEHSTIKLLLFIQ